MPLFRNGLGVACYTVFGQRNSGVDANETIIRKGDQIESMTRQEHPETERRQAGRGTILHLIFPALPAHASAEIVQTFRHGMTEFEEEMQTLCVQLGFQPVAHSITLTDFAAVLDAIPQGSASSICATATSRMTGSAASRPCCTWNGRDAG